MADAGWFVVGAAGGVLAVAGITYAAYKIWIYRNL